MFVVSLGMSKKIFTIGHSTRALEEFIALLNAFQIEAIADVRRFPGSRKFPHFNQENISRSLHAHDIAYYHFEELGGRRKASGESKKTAWRNKSFQGYADYMDTESFQEAVTGLKDVAEKYVTAIMCAEAVWWRCHRSLIADSLKQAGWEVIHILDFKKNHEHNFTSPAHIVQGKLFYY